MILWDLTPLTGRRASAERTVVIATYDVSYVLARVLLLSLLPAMLIGAMTYPLLHSYALIVVILAEAVITFVFYARSSNGLQLRLWRRVWNRSRAQNGKILLRNREVSPDRPPLVMVTQAAVPNPCIPEISDADVFGRAGGESAPAPVELAPAPQRCTDLHPDDWY